MKNLIIFFIDFIESNRIVDFKEKFFSSGYKSSEVEEWIDDTVFKNGEEKMTRIYFSEHINDAFSNNVSQTKKNMEEMLFNEPRKNVKKDLLKNLIHEVQALQVKYTGDEEYTKYNLDSHLKGLNDYFKQRLSDLSDGMLSLEYSNDNKLVWKGTSAQLITLFYRLMNEGIDGNPLIEEISKGEMKNFLQANFLTKDGHNIEGSTVDKVWAKGNTTRRKGFSQEDLKKLF